MRKFIAPLFWLIATIVLSRLTVRIAPYLVGTDTLAEQVNGTVPAGMMYIVALESLLTFFNLAICFCIGWLVARIIKNTPKKVISNEKQ